MAQVVVWLVALLPLIQAACVSDESLLGSYHFPLLELDAQVTQPANFLNHQHGVAAVHRTNPTEVRWANDLLNQCIH
jgi:hypothetical protein